MPKIFTFILFLAASWHAQASGCTREYMAVCGRLAGQTQTFPNRCLMKSAGAVFLSEGACPSHPTTKEVKLVVAAQDIACMGWVPMRCLQVKMDVDKNWSALYEPIEGFSFIPGFEYTLWVRINWIDKPSADGSIARYTLLRELSRLTVTTTDTPS